jgi:methionine--tRNA ligase beta chain
MIMVDKKPEITYEDFLKLDVRVGTIISASNVDGSTKLIKMEVDFGELGKRQILSGIAKWYSPEDLLNKQTSFVINLPYRKMMGLESQGMLFAVGLSDDAKPVLLLTSESIENGDGVR